LIEDLYLLKVYTALMLLKEFPSKSWNERNLRNLLKTDTDSADRRPGNGRPWTARTAENVILLVTSCSVRKVRYRHYQSVLEISRNIGIHRWSVGRIIHGLFRTTHQPKGQNVPVWMLMHSQVV